MAFILYLVSANQTYMKTYIYLVVLILLSFSSFAQSPFTKNQLFSESRKGVGYF
jgi:hypothetical protein